jgi:hypothetical protein
MILKKGKAMQWELKPEYAYQLKEGATDDTEERTHTICENKKFTAPPYQAFRWRPKRQMTGFCDLGRDWEAQLDAVMGVAGPMNLS